MIDVDKQIFLYINGFAGEVPVLDFLVKLVVNEYFVPVSLALIILYLWFSNKQKQVLSVAVLSVGLVNLLIAILNLFIVRERPFDVFSVNLLFYRPTDPSFPSNAAAVSFAMAVAIFIVNRRLGVFALSLATLYSFSRVYAGVHFPSDVIIGGLLGVAAVLFLSKFKKLINMLTTVGTRLQKSLGLEMH